ncbi:MAG: hypothetical protein ACR2OA_21995, partial [Rubripirellula sp.]
RGSDSRTRSTENKPSGLIHHQKINECPLRTVASRSGFFRARSRIPRLHAPKQIPIANTKYHQRLQTSVHDQDENDATSQATNLTLQAMPELGNQLA